MKVYVESILNCLPDQAWAEVQTSRLLLEITSPVLKILALPGAHFPERWIEGSTVLCTAYVVGFIPLGTHSLLFESIDSVRRQIQTRESNAIVRRWDHLISVRETVGGQTWYSDEIEVDAGALTLLVWIYAVLFYRYRQWRWKSVAKRLNLQRALPTG